MRIANNIKTVLKNPSVFLEWLIRQPGIRRLISDKSAISMMYRFRFHRKMDWQNPKSFNEKLLWLTLYDRNPVYTKLVDKYEAKRWMSEKLAGGGYNTECIIPTYGVFNSFDEIDFDELPSTFVIKTTHDSGTVFLCNDKNRLDYNALQRIMIERLKKNYYWYTREWQYKNVQPRIIIEKKLDGNKGIPEDYKIFCFNGKARICLYVSDREKDVRSDYYDMNWNKYPFVQGHPNSQHVIEKPMCWEKMVSVAECLSKGFPHIRVDFYIDKYGKFYIGELTLTHFSGLVPFEPDEWDRKLGEYLNLPNKHLL